MQCKYKCELTCTYSSVMHVHCTSVQMIRLFKKMKHNNHTDIRILAKKYLLDRDYNLFPWACT